MSVSSAPGIKPNRGLKAVVIAVGIALVAALAAFALALSGIITVPGITQASGELVLQGVDEQGRDPFSSVALAEPAPAAAPQTAAAPVTANQVSAGATGLYGGTMDIGRCDPAKLVAFLGSENAKAQAWVAALNADPNLRWGNNQPLTVADIPAYVAQLTSLVLLTDTVVTNHGFANGSPTPFQTVLQAGTAVLVDRYGVPRVRCMCGNPLLPPAQLPAQPKVTGKEWPGFNLTNVITIVNVVNVINVFQVVPYPAGGTPIAIPAGTCDPANPSTCGPPGPAGFVPTNAPAATATPAPTSAPTAAPTTPPAATTPVAPVGVQASDPNTTAPGEVIFVNDSRAPIDIYWIDFNGVPVLYATLLPGESYAQPTTEGHVWSVTSGSSTPLATEVAVAGSSSVVIR